MTRGERLCYQRRSALWAIALLLFLGGAIGVSWLLIDRDRLADQLATEADLRGEAVSTLAGDVRALRQQVKAEGETPVAPDPTKAVQDLPDRAEVPVPIPGEKGEKGDKGDPGDPGKPAPTIIPSPGASGASGVPGTPGRDATGVPGKDGQDGKDGRDGVDGQPGKPPAGWVYTDPQGVAYDCRPVENFDPDAPRYECTTTSTPEPTPEPQSRGLLGLAALTMTATYRKL